jgi:ribosomal protein L7/L12
MGMGIFDFLKQRKPPASVAPGTPEQYDAAIEDLVRRRQKIEAIKRYRERHGVGLKEAKDAIDALEERLRGR